MILYGVLVCGIIVAHGCRGRMYESSKSVVLLEGEKLDAFNVEQGVAQGCSLSPCYFLYSLMIYYK